jgi:circadian clock protein KaiC
MSSLVATGVHGLDDILAGGLTKGSLFLLEGKPGSGKTTIALQFLLEAENRGQRSLYITLSETKQELLYTAASHGWTWGQGIEICELQPPESLLDAREQQTLLYASDLELGETVKEILEAVERTRPDLIVLDSLSEIRLLAQGSLRYRRQLLALKHFLARRGVTVLMLDDLTTDTLDKTVHSIAHGVICLDEMSPNYGSERRRVKIAKYRGRAFRGGYHDFIIATGGVKVFPRLVASEHRGTSDAVPVPSGVSQLDQLLGGGVDKGTSTLVLGPAGAGKSLFVLQYAAAAMRRNEKVAVFVFDEEPGVTFRRAKGMGIDLEALRKEGMLIIDQIDAAELSPGEFSHRVSSCVVDHGVSMVVIDSLNGYQAAMPEEHALLLHMHELLQYLNRRGVSTFLTVAQHGLVGDMKSPVDVTYLADTVVLMRYFEAEGRVRRAVSVIKKRTGPHEDTIREFQVTGQGIQVGPALREFQGVLRGVPTYVGNSKLLEE